MDLKASDPGVPGIRLDFIWLRNSLLYPLPVYLAFNEHCFCMICEA
jgi:hypothetical protein